MKKFIKSDMSRLVLLAILIVFSIIWCNRLKSQVAYVDIDCPMCGSDEVLDFGTDMNGWQKCHCADCKTEFTIEE